MQDFLVSLAKILDNLGFVAKNSKNFHGFLSTILKNIAKSCKPCQEYLPKSWPENQNASTGDECMLKN